MLQVDIPAKSMTPEQFVYWLQGFAEIRNNAPNIEEWEKIKDHLQLVFKKETPNYQLNPLPATYDINDFNKRHFEQMQIGPTVIC